MHAYVSMIKRPWCDLLRVEAVAEKGTGAILVMQTWQCVACLNCKLLCPRVQTLPRKRAVNDDGMAHAKLCLGNRKHNIVGNVVHVRRAEAARQPLQGVTRIIFVDYCTRKGFCDLLS